MLKLFASACAVVAVTALSSFALAPDDATPQNVATTSAMSGPTVVAVGDIACPPGAAVTATSCQHAATATLAATYAPGHVLVLGDAQYDAGSLVGFQDSYGQSWGALKGITKPVPGNHEYRTVAASGYYSYFADQQSGAPGYYAFNISNWRVYALNSNCDSINCKRQVRWMNRNMANNPRLCTAIMMHHPRFSSGGEHGSSTVAKRFWNVAYKHGADMALAGHDHDYERFQRMGPTGPAKDGMISFVSGLGGKSLYQFGNIVQGSRSRYNDDSGVLALTLGQTQFAFEFKSIAGDVIDSGVRSCA